MEKASFPTQSDVLDNTQYGFSARFENGIGTNPKELIRAAHAGCFTIAISAQLGKANMIAESVTTNAAVTQEKIGDEFSITAIYLKLIAKIPGATHQTFEDASNKAKMGCPVSKLLNAKITLDA